MRAPPRQSRDVKSNWKGFGLAQVASTLDLFIVKSSVGGDIPGEDTFWASQGAGITDFVLASYKLLDCVDYLRVRTCQDSNHLPITLALKIQNLFFP